VIDRDQLAAHLTFAAELGVTGTSRDPVWRRREDPSRSAAAGSPTADTRAAAPDPAPVAIPLTVIRSGETLADIRVDIGDDCSRCKLHTLGRKQIVFGVGNPNADLMFVGEGPGADEDQQGIPFVGRAGQLLTRIIEAIDLKRDEVYIANVVKCRPPNNRNPEPDEVATCEPFLFRQIDAIKPKVIVTLGKFATQSLLRTDEAISRLRGRLFDYRGAKLVPTWHPAYVLRNNSPNSEVRREVWEDMKLVRSLLRAKDNPAEAGSARDVQDRSPADGDLA
jgi:DNA polymerase